MPRVLVTGGAGFIGSTLCRHLLSKSYEVTVLDNLTYAGTRKNIETIADDIQFHEGDIRDRELIASLYENADYVVNLAAESHVDRSIDDGSPFLRTNVEGAFTLFDELRNHDIKRFLQISTDEVYGSIEEGMFTEADQLDPSSPYSASKASADLFANAFRRTYHLPITIARCTNVYGPRQHPEKLIPKLILNALQKEPLPIYGDGTNVREWLFVDDAVRAIAAILFQSDAFVYNIGGGEERQNVEVARLILDHLGRSENLIEFVEDRKGHDFRYSLSYQRLQEDIGWEPSTEFENGLSKTIEWIKNREELWRHRSDG
jgi:dTDP-glucose 4,6-dehydratase